MFVPDIDIGVLPSRLRDFHNLLVPAVVYGVLSPLWYFVAPVVVSHTLNSIKGRPAGEGS